MLLLLLLTLFGTLTTCIDVKITPPDGSYIAFPPNTSVSHLPIEITINLNHDEICKDLNASSTHTLNMFANGDETLIHRQPTLSLPLNLCHKPETVTFTLQNVFYGTQNLILDITTTNGNTIAWTGYAWYSVVPHSLRETVYLPSGHGVVQGAVEPEEHQPMAQLEESAQAEASAQVKESAKLQVVIVGTDSLDGQKSIWMEQILHLQHHIHFTFICYVCSEQTNGESGGGSGFVSQLQQLKHDVSVIMFPGFDIDRALGLHAKFPHNVLSLLPLKDNGTGGDGGNRYSTGEKQFLDAYYQMFVKPLESKDILVFANSQSANDLFLAKAAQLANVAVVLDLPNLKPNARLNLNLIDAIVSPSSFAKHHLIKHSPWLIGVGAEENITQNQKIVVIPPGIDLGLFGPPPQSSMPLDSTAVYRIGFIARLAPEKSPGLFLRTVAVLEKYIQKNKLNIVLEYIVVGNGVLMESMKIISARLHVPWHKFNFTGWLSKSELSATLKSLHVVINPSLRESETFCIANIEALASGVPIVSLGSSGVGEYLNAKTNGTIGFVVGHDVPRNEWCYSMAMLTMELLQKKQDTKDMQKNSREMVVQRFSSETMVASYNLLYHRLSNAWPRRQGQTSIAVEKVMMEMAKSEVNKLSFDIKTAERHLQEVVHTGAVDDPYANLIRSSVLGITRFPIIAHLPNCTWHSLTITVRELSMFKILNESSWWGEFGRCPSVLEASERYARGRRGGGGGGAAGAGGGSEGGGRPGEHALRIDRIKKMKHVDNVIIGVSRNWRTAQNIDGNEEGVTILDGNHRSISIVERELLNAKESNGEGITLLLGLSEEFQTRKLWKGSFFCNR